MSFRPALFAAGILLCCGSARAAITISNAATQNMACAAGQCEPTASDAVLNVKDLETLLASGDLRVVTTGNGAEASDIRMTARLKWSSGATLDFVAYHSVSVQAAVEVMQAGGLSVTTDNGGTGGDLTFGPKGTIDFHDASSAFTFNGTTYALAPDLGMLAALIAAKPKGHFALSTDYYLTSGYSSSPIPTPFDGRVEGLGHTIANLSISTTDDFTGLFEELDRHAVVRDLKLSDVTIDSENSQFSYAGAVAGFSQGTVEYVQASGTIASNFWLFGGGITGISYGRIVQSFANVNVSGGDESELGGLAGNAHGSVTDCYAIGPANGGDQAHVGGLIGYSLATVTTAYATGFVQGGQNAAIGGFAAAQWLKHVFQSYWDTTTSGTDQGTGGGNIHGIKGLTTEQFQSGLPKGFDPSIWAEDANINGGLPYLINDAPGK